MKLGNHCFDFEHKSYIMGILNVTPDSFSDGGHYQTIDRALKQAEQMKMDGAAMIDIGGESTRPGHQKITEEEEIDRVLPVIEAIKKEIEIPISLDTYKYEVAKAGIEAGVHMINDIWGLKWDQRLAGLLAESGTACCLMHNRDEILKEHFWDHFCKEVEESLAIAKKAGIPSDRILLDPGVGFGKTLEQNRLVIKRLADMKRWELPILLGTSRKSVIGKTLDLPVDEREEGTIATTVYGRQCGVSVFRVHNVKANARALRMIDAILQEEC